MRAIYLSRTTIHVLLALALLLATIASICAPPRAAHSDPIRLYVKCSAVGANNGASWTDAYTGLQSALDAAAGGGYEIWVAACASFPYRPFRTVPPTNPSDTFQLYSNVAIYGGFAGITETLRSQRNWNTNVTTLSGYWWFFSNPYHVYHVVTGGNNILATAVLDGFTITGGNAGGTGFDALGGGMLNLYGGPTLSNLVFSGNAATSGGGGMYDYGGWAPALTNVKFSGNSSTGTGGGMRSENALAKLTNVVFTGNSAVNGGGIYVGGDGPTLVNVTFNGNSATSDGGGMHNVNGSPSVSNVIFSGNTAGSSGAGMSNDNCTLTLTNATFSGNLAELYGGAISNINGTNLTIGNSILWGDRAETVDQEIYLNPSITLAVSYTDVHQNGFGGNHNVNADPKFKRNPSPGADGNWGTGDDDYGDLHLQAGSPDIDAGHNASIPIGITTDVDGNKRIMGMSVDMGAYEAFLKLFLPLTKR